MPRHRCVHCKDKLFEMQGVLHYAWYDLFIGRENHHLNNQVLQIWKALKQVNEQVHLISHAQKQGFDRLPHCR